MPVLFTSSNQLYSDLGETWEPKETLNEVKFGHYQVNILAIGDSSASAGVTVESNFVNLTWNNESWKIS